MFRRTKLCTGLMLAFGGTAMMTANLALAQTTPPEGQGQRVEITGSRIATFNVEGTSPVTTVTAQDIKTEGVRNVENLLNNLPQVFADQGGYISNGATGTATVNLRNLGTSRTLVLINGRRLMGGSPRDPAADLNQIPASLIRRVEVLTGGASAVYGSDAVAGVVNFIMNDKFEGVQVDYNYSFYNHQQQGGLAADAAIAFGANAPLPGDKGADGKSWDLGVTVGGNFADGKGNATVFLGFKRDYALTQSERDFSACAIGPDAAGTGYVCAGSGTHFPGRFTIASGPRGPLSGLPSSQRRFTIADTAGTTRAETAGDLYNFAPLNYYQRPSDRYLFSAFAHYDVAPKARIYSEFSFHDDHTVAQIAPSGLFGVLTTLHSDNPLLSADFRSRIGMDAANPDIDIVINRRNVEGGPRQDDIRHTSFRGVLGVKGEINPVWAYDVYGYLGKVIYQEVYRNEFSITRSSRALDVVTDPATGTPVCRSALDGTDPACVPYDIFRLGAITPEALAYLQTPGFQRGHTAQNVWGGTVSGDLGQYGIKLPTANTGLEVLVGAEHRLERLSLETDTAFTSGDLAGQGGPTISVAGDYSVRDIFAEARMPLIEKKPFAHLLSANASYRNSKYDTAAGNTDTYGLGLEYAPVEMARLRGTYQRAVRAPNVIELFSAQALGLFDMTSDPCAGPTPSRTLAECARTGVTAAQYGNIDDNPAGQYNALFGGNPLLSPETADSVTLGLVLTPTKDLSLTLDAFSIKVKDTLGIVPPAFALDQCLDTGSPVFCSMITRDRLGTLWQLPEAQILGTTVNIGRTETSGMDVGANYRMRVGGGWGGLNLGFVGTYLKKFEVEPVAGMGSYDCAGLYGSATCGTPSPKWRHKLRTTWNTPWNADFSVTWRHFAKVRNEGTSSNPLLNNPDLAPIDAVLGARNYLDLAAAWTATKNLTVTLGINNVLDKDPPISSDVGAGFGNGNTFPQVYDALGRKVFLGLTAKF